MSGLYSPINRLMEQVTRPKGTGAEYMAELQKKPGYKPAEAEDRDLQALMALPQMQRAEFMEKLKAQANKFPLKHRELTNTQTHHGQYTLPGGENYREILLHTPMPEGQGFEGRSYHFGGMPNILASIRVKDRISPEGKKALHIEEIQSDWHQQGREAGYHPKDLDKQIKEVAQWKKRLEKESTFGMDKYERAEHQNALEEAEAEHNKLLDMQEQGVPYGPHAKDWHELALKAMIQHAAENGYHQIAVTPGAEQAKRYSLSKQVGSVSYDPINRHFQAFKPNRETITSEKGATPERIQALIGKEAAAKLLQAPQTMGHHYLEGENLDIGGEGMKGFYDRMVPTFLNKFGKKHGVQVQQGTITVPDEINMGSGAKANMGDKPAPVHTFDITPAMREDVLKNGIPRYADGGEVEDVPHLAIGGQGPKNWLKGSVEGVIKPLMSQGPTEADRKWLEQHGQKNPEASRIGLEAIPRTQAINQWVERNLGNYIRKQMATHDDPIRKLAEQGIVHMPPEQMGYGSTQAEGVRKVHGAPRLGQSPEAQAWEDAADVSMHPYTIEQLSNAKRLFSGRANQHMEPWMEKADPQTKVYEPTDNMHAHYLGFDHLVDILKEDLASGHIRPEQLSKISIEHAVRRAHQYDQERKKAMAETALKATEGMPIHKEYPEGYKWLELSKPEIANELPPTHKVEPYQSKGGLGQLHRVINTETGMRGEGYATPERATKEFLNSRAEERLADALKYEGDTMGHCVGGYCPDVVEGKSRIFSLRDAKNEPHVTIETRPSQHLDYNSWFGKQPENIKNAIAKRRLEDKNHDIYEGPEYLAARAAQRPTIQQIKGKSNAKPKKDYIPYVQDFVRSGNWSNIGDFQNTDLIRKSNLIDKFSPEELDAVGKGEYLTPSEHDDLLLSKLTPKKAKGGGISRGTVKDKVTMPPSMDTMLYELINRKAK